ncbi:AMP-binding protein [Neptunicoccus cionae]|uniref:AMP-binding protein n=1 Tax=Neptunicoccus cionae TaxID=2035344 RepID=UPI0011AE2DBA|nr:AMP-binding protein [Amylibacter cionae]
MKPAIRLCSNRIEPACNPRYTARMNKLIWHPKAALTDFDGVTLTAAQAAAVPATRQGNPADPARAMAGFFQALEAGLSPVIGPPVTAPDLAGHFFTLTGGSSGPPKVIRRSASSWGYSIAVLAGRLGLGPDARVGVFGDLTYSLSLYAAVEALCCGAHLHFLPRSGLAARGITHLYATPTQLRLIRQIAPDVTHVISGGGPFDPETAAHVATILPNAQVWRFYGAAETSFITLADSSAPANAVGAAFPGVDIEIRDPKGQPCQSGAEGLVWVRSPMLFTEYASGQSGSTQVKDGWITVGEIGRLGSNGFLFLTGRQDRILTIADTSVSLDQLEIGLITAGATAAAVLPVPDPLRGYILHGFVEGAAPCPAALKTLTNLPELPRLASGKPDYRALERLLP